MQFVEYYRQYADEYSEESREEVTHDGSSELDKLFFRLEEAEAVMMAFENLNYRERAMADLPSPPVCAFRLYINTFLGVYLFIEFLSDDRCLK